MPGGVEQPGVLRPSSANVLRGSNIASLGAMPMLELEARNSCPGGRRRLFDLL